jgi:hypothetical protein
METMNNKTEWEEREKNTKKSKRWKKNEVEVNEEKNWNKGNEKIMRNNYL